MIKAELSGLWKMEEIYWKQRAKVHWLKEGDMNTKFFHLTTIQRRQRNKVIQIKNDDGVWLCGENLVGAELKRYFENLFTSSGERDWGNIFGHVEPIITPDMNANLTAPFTEDEILIASKQLGALKAPGPDGFPNFFYHRFWNTMKKVVIGTANDMYNNLSNLQDLNQTHIALIPKVAAPDKANQFRPISLCNSSYKILSKILANRLKSILPLVISENQNAFLQERQIQDNIILAHEAFHHLRNKKKGKCFEAGLKMDMNKAFDRVEWDFLRAAMSKMGFADFWIHLVMGCITTVSFSVLLNGKPGKSFTPTRGIRQGDPLSPYLFLIVSEILSINLNRCIESGSIRGVKIARSGPPLSHIFFADDSLLFFRAERINCIRLKEVLDRYCRASGQQINLEKSNLFFSSNTPDDHKASICHMLGIGGADNPGTCLGLQCYGADQKNWPYLLFVKEFKRR